MPPLLSTHASRQIAEGLADAFVAGRWELEELVDRGGRVLGRRPRWLQPLVSQLIAAFGTGARPASARVAAFLHNHSSFRRACAQGKVALTWVKSLRPVMHPAPGRPSTWSVPAITTRNELAERLGLAPGELEWFADCQARGIRTPAGRLRHYRYRFQSKRSGAVRLIEAPKPRLKAIQRRLLEEILEPIPPHEAAHGFRRSRSVRTYVAPHVGQPIVLKMDLRDFFPAITAARVKATFLTAGYPEPVAVTLAGLCTNGVPSEVWDDSVCPILGTERSRLRRLYRQPHLPQGAPTSPALANLCAYRLDCRLAELAASAGARYTRYADDLAFSGGPAVARLSALVGAIALEEGFVVQTRKTRVMRRGVRQRVAGVVLNERPNVPRPEYEVLKAILHNCLRHGPDSQNRSGHADFRAHLAGRIAYLESLNPNHGQRLRSVFEQIRW